MNSVTINSDYYRYVDKIHSYFNRFLILSKEEFVELWPFFEIRSFEKKQQLVKIGEIDNYFNIILKGLVRKYTMVGKRCNHTIIHRRPDYSF